MLKLTKKADYALMAMKHLAENAGQGAHSAKDVADAFGIPPEALAKILQRLAMESTAVTRWDARRTRFRPSR
jgi:DNA-binding IscR family transcriptional regulator